MGMVASAAPARRLSLTSATHSGGAGREGTYSCSPKLAKLAVAAPSQILSDCVYMWERTVMGISVHTAETEMATTPY